MLEATRVACVHKFAHHGLLVHNAVRNASSVMAAFPSSRVL